MGGTTPQRATLLPPVRPPGGGREQSDDETLKLMNQDGNRADLLAHADRVRSVLLQPPDCLRLGKSDRAGDVERGEDITGKLSMGSAKRTFGCLGNH